MKNLILFILVIATMLSSCHKDSENDSSMITTSTSSPYIQNATEGLLYGLIHDYDGNPLENVKVSSMGRTATTDENGLFNIRNATLAPTGIYVTAEHPTYFLGSDLVYSSGEDGYVSITMLPLDNAKKFDATTGGNVTIDGGGDIVFSSESIVDNNGNHYNGEVTAYAKRIATDDPQFSDIMPGGLIAKDNKGRTVVLGSMGMVAVELRSNQGEELNLKEGTTAKVSFPIAENQKSIAEETIETWYFDESQGLWIEEGIATKVGDSYVANLSHFSFWNCDVPFELIKMQGRYINQDGDPLANHQINTSAEGYGTGYGRTDMNGYFCGLVPKNAVVKLSLISSSCMAVLDESDFGPYDTNVDVGDIVVNTSFTDIDILCNGSLAANTIVTVTVDGVTNSYWSIDGSLSIDFTCATSSITMQAYNQETGNTSPEETFDPNNLPSVIDLVICEVDCTLALTLTSNNLEVCTQDEVMITANVTGGSGNYSYQWENGETTQTVSNFTGQSQNTICVLISDIDTGCEQNFCLNNFFYAGFFAEVFQIRDCDNGDDFILIDGFEGVVFPVTVEVSETGDIDTYNSSPIRIGPMSPGVYNLIITNTFGCEFIPEPTPVNSSGIFAINAPNGTSLCNNPAIPLQSLPYSPNYVASVEWSSGQTTPVISVTEPGQYCVTVTTTDGCEYESCIDITGAFIEPIVEKICATGNNMEFIHMEWFDVSPSTITYEDIILGNNIYATDFGAWAIITVSSEGCIVEVDKEIISNAALGNFTINNTSCSGCEDGYVTWENNSASVFCDNCIFDEVRIYNINNINEDLFNQNEQQGLAPGNYVMVGIYQGECVNMRREFTIE